MKTHTMRKIIFALFFVSIFAFFVPATSYADEAGSVITVRAPFVALTSIPGLEEAANSKSIPILLNNLYKLAIGLAAVIAVIKIVQGGITYMLGDSVTEKREARHHISMAVLGLLLVLSPWLVFNVIDPRILDLNVDVSALTPPAPSGSSDWGALGQTDPAIRAAASAACGFTLTPEEEACFVADSSRGDGVSYVSRCLQGRTAEQVECMDEQANRADDPAVINSFPGMHEGTYLAWGIIRNANNGNTPVGADIVAQEWIRQKCSAPKRAVLRSCTGQFNGNGYCMSMPAYCTVQIRVTEMTIGLFGAWEIGAQAEKTADETFRRECRDAAADLNQESIGLGGSANNHVGEERGSEHPCSDAELTTAGRSTVETPRCRVTTLTCGLAPR